MLTRLFNLSFTTANKFQSLISLQNRIMAAKQPRLNDQLCPRSNIESPTPNENSENVQYSRTSNNSDSEDNTSSPTSSPVSPRITRNAAAVAAAESASAEQQQQQQSTSRSNHRERWHNTPDAETAIQYLRVEMRDGQDPVDVAHEIGGPTLASKLHQKYIAQ